MKLFQPFNVTPLMESNQPLSRDVLHEDLQILRHTLAAISDDVRRFSTFSAEAVERAIRDLDLAHYALARDGDHPPVTERKPDASPAYLGRTKKRASAFSPTPVQA